MNPTFRHSLVAIVSLTACWASALAAASASPSPSGPRWVTIWESETILFEVDASSYIKLGELQVVVTRSTYPEPKTSVISDIVYSVDINQVAVTCPSRGSEIERMTDSVYMNISARKVSATGIEFDDTPPEEIARNRQLARNAKAPIRTHFAARGSPFRPVLYETVSSLFWRAACDKKAEILSRASKQRADPPYDCSRSAQHYQDEYRRTQDVSALVCVQRALKREIAR